MKGGANDLSQYNKSDFRAGTKDIAYWEFEIAGIKGLKSREHEGKSSGIGSCLPLLIKY